MIYKITGKTFHIKEELKNWGCKWDAHEKVWRTTDMLMGSIAYKEVKGLCFRADCDMVAIKLKPECKKIQDILQRDAGKKG